MSHLKTKTPRRRIGAHTPSSTDTADSSSRETSTRTSARPVWESHDLSTSEGRIALAPLAKTLTNLADVTTMRTYVRAQVDRLWPDRPPPASVQKALTALDEQEKAFKAEATSTPDAVSPTRTTVVQQADVAEPDSEPAPIGWNAEDVESARGRGRLLEALDTISDPAQLDAMAKALAKAVPDGRALASATRLQEGITARKAKLANAAPTGLLTKTLRTERPDPITVQVPVQRIESATRARWNDQVKTADGVSGLRDELTRVTSLADIVRLRRTAKEELTAIENEIWAADRGGDPVSADRKEAEERLSGLLSDIDARAAREIRTLGGIRRLREELAHVSTLDDIETIGGFAELELALIRVGNRHRDADDNLLPESVQKDIQQGWKDLLAAVGTRENEFDPQLPTSWEECRTYSEKLRHRHGFRQPRPMLEHLYQRLGDSQRGERPPVRVRRIVNGVISYVAVTPDNYRQVLQEAASRSWTTLSDDERVKLQTLTNEWGPLGTDPNRVQARADLWFTELDLRTKEFTSTTPPTKESFRDAVNTATKSIYSWVEPEVLRLLDLPKIIVHGPTNTDLGDRPAYYSAKDQTIHVAYHAVAPDRILHEFGHHVEETGPVEVWCGLASYLRESSDGLPLDPPVSGSTRTPAYGRTPEKGTSGVSNYYSLSYYEDAGTELIALGLEDHVPDKPDKFVSWPKGETGYDPRYMAAMIHAIRPKAYAKAGLTLPGLLK